MSRRLTIVDDFSVGEVSPLTEAKLSSDEFKNGLREATNIVPDSHGPMIGRPGFEHVRPIAIPAGNGGTLFEVNYSPEEYFVVVLYELVLEVVDKSGAILALFATPYTNEDLHGPDGNQHLAQSFLTPSGLVLNICMAEHPPYKLEFTRGTPWTVVFEAIVFTGAPAAWVPGNYPTTGTIFQGRSWWGGARDDPDTFWASRSFAYYDLAYGSPPGDTDGIEFTISRHGRIRWMAGGRSLVIGTEAGEFIVSSETNVITPTDISVEMQSAYGSKTLGPQLIGNEVVYVTSDGRKLRSMWWKWVESGWVSLDATFTAEHITRTGMTDIAFARNPYSNIWGLLANGKLISCSYRRDSEEDPIVGWFTVDSDYVDFIAIAVIEELGTSHLWALGRSKDGEATHLYKYYPHDYESDDQQFLDGYVYLRGAPTDKPNFAGKFFTDTVTVVADGFHLPNMKVEANGDINLPTPASKILAGYPYVQRAETMPLISTGDKGVSSSHHMKRWNAIYLRLIKSYMPKVNGHRPPERHSSTHDDIPEPFINSFVQITPGFGWDRDGILIIEQELPFRLVLTGIYGEVSLEII